MGDTQKGKNEKILIGVLCGLITAVVVLVVVILIAKIREGKEVAVDNSDCSIMEDEEQRKCLNELYASEGSDGSKEMFDRSLNRALDTGEDEQAMWLILEREESLVIDENCEKMLELVNDERIDKLPADQFFYYSSYVMGDVAECGDTEKVAQLREKYFALIKSGLLSHDLLREDRVDESLVETTDNLEEDELVEKTKEGDTENG